MPISFVDFFLPHRAWEKNHYESFKKSNQDSKIVNFTETGIKNNREEDQWEATLQNPTQFRIIRIPEGFKVQAFYSQIVTCFSGEEGAPPHGYAIQPQTWHNYLDTPQWALSNPREFWGYYPPANANKDHIFKTEKEVQEFIEYYKNGPKVISVST